MYVVVDLRCRLFVIMDILLFVLCMRWSKVSTSLFVAGV